MQTFQAFSLATGCLCDLGDDRLPSQFNAWSNQSLELTSGATHFGYVFSGNARVECGSGSFTITRGMYFCLPGCAKIEASGGADTSAGIVVSRLGFDGFFQLGGPIEERGRLGYIDGCTDSLLVPPVMVGDPCLNLLHFPGHIDQTIHTHPSFRAGMVARGRGECLLGEPQQRIKMVPGTIFLIPADTDHAFATGIDPMSVIAFHPDSNFGPAHDDHPMLNRTMVDGISARFIDRIRTQQ